MQRVQKKNLCDLVVILKNSITVEMLQIYYYSIETIILEP